MINVEVEHLTEYGGFKVDDRVRASAEYLRGMGIEPTEKRVVGHIVSITRRNGEVIFEVMYRFSFTTTKFPEMCEHAPAKADDWDRYAG